MPANKLNYLVLYVGDSQVYGAGSEDVALSTAPPDGISLEDKRILFVSFEPDNEVLTVHPLSKEEVMNADIKVPQKKEKKETDG